MKILVALCFVVVTVYSQIPKPCQSPPQWESKEIKVEQKYGEYRKISYDETNRRVREFAEVKEGDDKEYYDRLYLYNEMKNYTLNLKTRKCTVMPLTRPFHYRGVHPNAKFDGIFNIGAVGIPGEVVAVQAFSANETEGFYTGLVTYPGCFPIQNLYFSKMYGYEHSDYFDLNIGITDPNVFDVPRECVMAEKHLPLVL